VDIVFNLLEFRYGFHRRCRYVINTADVKFVKFAPDMRPAPDQGDALIATGLNLLLGHAGIGTVPINLEDASEAV